MTECEKRELIRSMAMGMPFEEISRVYEMSMDDINEEIQFQKMKWGE